MFTYGLASKCAVRRLSRRDHSSSWRLKEQEQVLDVLSEAMMDLGKIIYYSMIFLIILFSFIILVFISAAFKGSSPDILSISTKPIGNLGEDELLSCYLNTENPQQRVNQVTVTWEKKDLNGLVYLYESGAPNLKDQAAEFKGRTQLFSEAVTTGNGSLLLRNVRRSDEGEYTCAISSSSGGGKVTIHLRTAAFSAPTFTSSNSTLVAEASRWFPKPNVIWTNQTGDELEGSTRFTEGSDGIFSVVSTLQDVNVGDTYNCRIENNLVTADATVTGAGVLTKTFFTFSVASSLLALVYLNVVTCVVCIYYMT
ncbi:V-set domain-containing T-cell activation inhibitor 1-like [Mugil cephalus]|uniref:V-set domain-containing T-cell activation inhibitor 1-like n=1 Tax=Mugil cephalus TaxID=48193 RepID=UPI001FB60C1B|nr:V-set domain-containing T-cell activation inhibitor 1-like [Mugil cephalus]